MQIRTMFAFLAMVAFFLPQSVFAAEPIDRSLARENAGLGIQPTPLVNDLAFLRRISVDLIGRIPTEAEIQEYLALPESTRREETIQRLLNDERFVDRWTAFFADMLRIRTRATGGSQFLAYVHQSLQENKPYDEMCRELISAQGKVGKTAELGYILGDDADPMALAGSTSQVFLGIRIACAQCHDHPFDVWQRKQFYEFAAFFGRTKRVESNLTGAIYTIEQDQNVIQWPPEDEAEPEARTPVRPKFPFEMDARDGDHIARLIALRSQPAPGEDPAEASIDDLFADAESKIGGNSGLPDGLDVKGEAKKEVKNLNLTDNAYPRSELREKLAELMTDPRNRAFSRNLVNRVWAELIGRGFVEPIDDFSAGNPISHPETLDLLADEFVASGYNFKALVEMIVTSQVYQRSPLYGVDEGTRLAAEEAFAAAPMRRMISEALYDSIVQAGHLFDVKHPAGANLRSEWRYTRVAIRKDGEESNNLEQIAQIENSASDSSMQAGMANSKPMNMKAPGYDLEKAIEFDFDQALEEKPEVELAMMEKKSNEELEAEKMQQQASMEYLDRYVRVTYDYNPKFGSAFRMATPANPEHFLRIFGQPGRADLGDFRDESANMRQALMMLNGQLTHQAARVGDLEPIHKLLVGEKANLEAAIRLAYREILTREPKAEDLAFAHEIIDAAKNPVAGMADLRWVLLNSHEFRFLP